MRREKENCGSALWVRCIQGEQAADGQRRFYSTFLASRNLLSQELKFDGAAAAAAAAQN